jgi:hypothetical protein
MSPLILFLFYYPLPVYRDYLYILIGGVKESVDRLEWMDGGRHR